jgi:hypothetical protein
VNSPFRQQPGRPDVVRHRKLHCPACGCGQNAAARPDRSPGPGPSDGDYSICFRCGEVSVYTVSPLGVALREATSAELVEFAANPDNTRAVRDIHAYWARTAGDT